MLSFEATNYNALVFLGLALLHLDKPAESESAYVRAIKQSPASALAWQGLSNLFEKQHRTDKLVETLEELIRIFEAACVRWARCAG